LDRKLLHIQSVQSICYTYSYPNTYSYRDTHTYRDANSNTDSHAHATHNRFGGDAQPGTGLDLYFLKRNLQLERR
jgi:hypothetical protein